MCLHRNARIRNGANLLGNGCAALQLDRVSARLLHQSACVAHGFGNRRLIAHKRHIHDDHSVLARAHDAGAVVDHVLHRNRQGRVITHHGHAERITHQNGVDARFFHQLGGRVIVAGNLGEAFAVLLHREKCTHCVLHSFCSFSPFSRAASVP